MLHDFVMQNDPRKPRPVSNSGLKSPWEGTLLSAGLDDGTDSSVDSDDDDFVVSYVSA